MLFPKTKEKKKRMRHPASILHDKNSRTCYLCVTLHDNWNEHRILDEHHVFGGPNRKKFRRIFSIRDLVWKVI